MAKNKFRRELYDERRMEQLRLLIIQGHEMGKPIPYEILVDDFPTIEKNSNPELFSNYTTFINSQTQSITIIIYHGESNSNDKYIFYFNPEDLHLSIPTKRNTAYNNTAYNNISDGLKGLPQNDATHEPLQKVTEPLTEDAIKERLLKEMRFDELQTQNAVLTNHLKEMENVIRALEEARVDIKKNRDLNISSVIDLGITALVKNGELEKRFPQIQALAGFLKGSDEEEDSKTEKGNVTFKAKGKPSETEEDVATFRRKKDKSETAENQSQETQEDGNDEDDEDDSEEYVEALVNKLPEHYKGLIQFFTALQENLPIEDFKLLMELIEKIIDYPKAIRLLSNQLNNYIKQKTASNSSEKTNPPSSQIGKLDNTGKSVNTTENPNDVNDSII
jgi:hypothetical protein